RRADVAPRALTLRTATHASARPRENVLNNCATSLFHPTVLVSAPGRIVFRPSPTSRLLANLHENEWEWNDVSTCKGSPRAHGWSDHTSDRGMRFDRPVERQPAER